MHSHTQPYQPPPHPLTIRPSRRGGSTGPSASWYPTSSALTSGILVPKPKQQSGRPSRTNPFPYQQSPPPCLYQRHCKTLCPLGQ